MAITRLEPKKWLIDFTYHKQRYRRTICGTRQAADQAIRHLKEKADRERYGMPGPRKRIKFKDYADIYIENYPNERSLHHIELHGKRLKAHFGDKFLDEISPGSIEDYQRKRKKVVAPITVNRELATLKAIFNKAIKSEDYQIDRNPVNKVKFFPERNDRKRILTDEERLRLIRAAEASESKWLYLFITICLNTGMRKMEVLSLKWENVNFSKRYIEVTPDRDKSGRGRKIPLNDVIIDELKKIEKVNEYVFYNPKTGTFIRNIKTAFWHICEKAKLTNFRVHDLRHTAASWLVNDCGIDVVTASKILGHSDLKITLKYIHPTEEHKLRGVEKLGEMYMRGRRNVVTSTQSVVIDSPPLHHMRGH
jgi:integrase